MTSLYCSTNCSIFNAQHDLPGKAQVSEQPHQPQGVQEVEVPAKPSVPMEADFPS